MIELTQDQQKAFQRLWFIYGNNGKKCTLFNHKLVQGFVEHSEDRREDYKGGYENLKARFGEKMAKESALTDECVEVCTLVLDGKIEEAINMAKL